MKGGVGYKIFLSDQITTAKSKKALVCRRAKDLCLYDIRF